MNDIQKIDAINGGQVAQTVNGDMIHVEIKNLVVQSKDSNIYPKTISTEIKKLLQNINESSIKQIDKILCSHKHKPGALEISCQSDIINQRIDTNGKRITTTSF